MGSVLATYIGRLVYGIKPDLMTTRPIQSSASAFWVELIATFMIMFLAASLTHQAHAVRKKIIFFLFRLGFLLLSNILSEFRVETSNLIPNFFVGL